MLDAQQMAEIREMKDEWVIPPYAPARAALNCDEEIREWLDEDSYFVVLVSKHHRGPEQDSKTATPVASPPTLEQRFLEQADKWDRETAHISSPNQRFAHPSYEAIRGMANEDRAKVIDLLLQDMQKNRREWFWMLSYLTHENPVEGKDVGRLDKMINAWVKWGRTRRGR